MFKIGNKEINATSPTYVIAEIGVNHNGSMELAKQSIDAAVFSGADAVKFQTFKSEKLVSKFARKAKYQAENTNDSESSQLDMLKKLELSNKDFIELKEYCEEKGIEFLSTPFDEESAEFLKEINVHAFKIGSGDLNNYPFLSFISKLKIPVILSTGMSTLSEIEEALEVLQDSEVSLLHCTSVYPAPLKDVNLYSLITMKNAFHKLIGYSDHTLGNEVTISAITLGAKIIEKHFTLDKNLPGPDHKASLDPAEFAEMVRAIRNVEMSFGDGIKRCMPSEIDTKLVARKSLVVLRDLNKGDVLTEHNLGIKRPGNGIEPKYYDLLLGKQVKMDIKEDQALKWEDLL
jgi:N,N'-diacetyllegionaminate synthase